MIIKRGREHLATLSRITLLMKKRPLKHQTPRSPGWLAQLLLLFSHKIVSLCALPEPKALSYFFRAKQEAGADCGKRDQKCFAFQTRKQLFCSHDNMHKCLARRDANKPAAWPFLENSWTPLNLTQNWQSSTWEFPKIDSELAAARSREVRPPSRRTLEK